VYGKEPDVLVAGIKKTCAARGLGEMRNVSAPAAAGAGAAEVTGGERRV